MNQQDNDRYHATFQNILDDVYKKIECTSTEAVVQELRKQLEIESEAKLRAQHHLKDEKARNLALEEQISHYNNKKPSSEFGSMLKEAQQQFMDNVKEQTVVMLKLQIENQQNIESLKDIKTKYDVLLKTFQNSSLKGASYENEVREYLENTLGSFVIVQNVAHIAHKGDIHLLFDFPCEIKIMIDTKNRTQRRNAKGGLVVTYVSPSEIDKFDNDIDDLKFDGAILFSNIGVKRRKASDDPSNVEYAHRGNTIVAYVSNNDFKGLLGAVFHMVAEIYSRRKTQELHAQLDGAPKIKAMIIKLIGVIKFFHEWFTSQENATKLFQKQWPAEYNALSKTIRETHDIVQKEDNLKDIVDVELLKSLKQFEPHLTRGGGTVLSIDEKQERREKSEKQKLVKQETKELSQPQLQPQPQLQLQLQPQWDRDQKETKQCDKAKSKKKAKQFGFVNQFMDTQWDQKIMSYIIYQNETSDSGIHQQRGYVIFNSKRTLLGAQCIISKKGKATVEMKCVLSDEGEAIVQSILKNQRTYAVFTFGERAKTYRVSKRSCESKEEDEEPPMKRVRQ